MQYTRIALLHGLYCIFRNYHVFIVAQLFIRGERICSHKKSQSVEMAIVLLCGPYFVCWIDL